MTTIAESIATLLGHDGQNFTADDGRALETLLSEHRATPTYSRRTGSALTGGIIYEAGPLSDHEADDPIRWDFADGSALVTAGDCWDIAGGGFRMAGE